MNEHLERGAFRSGEGSPEQIHARLKLFREIEELEDMEENHAFSLDKTM